MRFQDIPGQEEIKAALTQSVQRNHLAHAQLFAGNEGGAGLPLALAFAAYIFCTNKTTDDSCGTCANCTRIHKGVHPDLHFFFPKITVKESEYDKKLGEFLKSFRDFIQESPYGLVNDFTQKAGFDNKGMLISKEDSRRLIRTVSMKPVEGAAKVLLIWLPEYFNPTSANAILKVLEEPPANTIYLLVSYAHHSLLATITSRVLLFSIPPFSDAEITQYLISKGTEAGKAETLAKISHGSIGEALHLSGETDEMAYQDFQAWMRECLRGEFATLMSRAETFGKSGKLAQRSMLQFAMDLLREALVSGEPSLNSRTGDEADFMIKFNGFLSLDRKKKLYEELNQALHNLDRNASAKMVHFHLSTTFSQLLAR